eukprot:TRINITY_DN5687_c0_g1_i1.p1 TRINITY_DN5687_c0_g1~~TRINITY_DN5687_c0_g1_i1.p1  ORF type:complete len:1064 (+),score=323.46 TRINITY_DN5687_c0_g1_i1:95-3193(+)
MAAERRALLLLLAAVCGAAAQDPVDCNSAEGLRCVTDCSRCLDDTGAILMVRSCSVCLPCVKYAPCAQAALNASLEEPTGNLVPEPLSPAAGATLIALLGIVLGLTTLLSGAATYVAASFLRSAGASHSAPPPSPSSLPSPLSKSRAARRARLAKAAGTLEEPLVGGDGDVEMMPPRESHQTMAPLTHDVSLTFEHLNYSVWYNGQKRQILHDASGYLSSGNFTAIMGPSGSGKTTLLNMLSGRARSGEFRGRRCLNGRELNVADYKTALKAQGYVLQEDTFFEELTVRQSLSITAAMKMAGAAPEQVRERTADLIRDCRLGNCADTRIGGAGGGKGISGGQRRRLSIAEQLVGRPDILLLDEPTSGLDATSSLQLCKLLRHLAVDMRHVVCTTIHQPRPEIMALFTHLFLLCEGGTVAYFGPAEQAVPFLVTAGVGQMRDGDNPGDFIIDALALDDERLDEAELDEMLTPGQSVRQKTADFAKSRTALADAYVASAVHREALRRVAELRTKDYPPREQRKFATSVLEQINYLFARRLARSFLADWRTVAGQLASIVLISAVLSSAFCREVSSEPGIVYDQVAFICMIVSYLCIQQYLISVPDFFAERKILLKERASGDCRLSAYLICVYLWETPRAIVHALIVMAAGYVNPVLHLDPASPKVCFFAVCLASGLVSWHGAVLFLSFTTDREALVWSVTFLLMSAGVLYSGLVVPYSAIWYPWLPWYFTSIPAYTFRALIIRNAEGNPALDMDCEAFADWAVGIRYALVPDAEPPGAPPPGGRCQAGPMHTAFLLFKYEWDTSNSSYVNVGLPTLAVFGFHDAWTYTNVAVAGAIGLFLRLFTYWFYRWRDRRGNTLVQIPPEGGGRGPDPPPAKAAPAAPAGAPAGGAKRRQSTRRTSRSNSTADAEHQPRNRLQRQAPAALLSPEAARAPPPRRSPVAGDQRLVAASGARHSDRAVRPGDPGTATSLHARGVDAVAAAALSEILDPDDEDLAVSREAGDVSGPLFEVASEIAAESARAADDEEYDSDDPTA